jgi:hypothetical protein
VNPLVNIISGTVLLIVAGVMSLDAEAAKVPPAVSGRDLRCGQPYPQGSFHCNAAMGHPGPHVLYAQGVQMLTWPQRSFHPLAWLVAAGGAGLVLHGLYRWAVGL